MSKTPKYIVEHIQHAREKGETKLDLHNEGLSEIPEEVFEQDSFEEIWLNNIRGLSNENQIRSVPTCIDQLKKLRWLVLFDNPLEAVADVRGLALDFSIYQKFKIHLSPTHLAGVKFTSADVTHLEECKNFPNLTLLYLSYNQLTQLPESVGKLQNLTWLDLNENELTQLPESVAKLQNLTSLVLDFNRFTQLPESVAKLQNLTLLVLSYNRFTQLPESLAKLQSLTSLDLSHNQFTQLPESIAKLQNLTELNLSNNQLTQLPESLTKLQNLTKLDLSKNRIQTLSAFITQLKNIQTIYFKEKYNYHSVKRGELVLSENPIQYPPKEVVAAGMEAIRSFFSQQAAQGKQKLYEAKLILVGEPGAGKTSLMQKLLDENYPIPNPADKSTVGITVKTGWQFPYVKDHALSFAANLWDFGGQDIQYMTHQFFLTSRALYVLLVDDRKQHTQFDYWFNIIKLLGAGSPVLVALNERDCRSITNFDYDSFRKYYANDFAIEKHEVDLGEADLDRFRSLRKLIQKMLCELPHIGAELPAQWIPIRQELEKRRMENHITLAEYSRICESHQISRLQDQLVLSQYLHYLGIILHFQEDPQLAETVFLNPQWVAHAVYTILESDHAKKHKGRFSKKWMFGLWQEKGHSFAECNKLLNLMLKNNFELCYPIDNGGVEEYIAPQLLPSTQPAYSWSEKDNLHFRYQYQFMPKSIITRLIVRLNHLIERRDGEDLVWEKGVVLNKNGVRAQVTEEITKNEGLKVINMVLDGVPHGQKEFLADLRAEVRGIHEKSFKGINVKEMVPIPAQPEVAVSYEHLKTLERLGEPTFIPQGLQ